jgi:hypothetical protein
MEMEQRERSIQRAADAALKRLEARGFPGAVRLADPKRKMRAAWHLCEVSANRPHGGSGTSSYYLFSTGQVAAEGGGSVLAAREPDKIIAALGRLS